MGERVDLVVIDGVQYQRNYAIKHGLIEAEEPASKTGGPSRSTARTPESARAGGAQNVTPPAGGGVEGGSSVPAPVVDGQVVVPAAPPAPDAAAPADQGSSDQQVADVAAQGAPASNVITSETAAAVKAPATPKKGK